MSRSPKALPPMGAESDARVAKQEQLSLFASPETGSPSVQIEAKTVVRTKKHMDYSAADIQVLEGIAAIRHRPGM